MARDTVNAAALRELLQILETPQPRPPSGTPIAVRPDVLTALKALVPSDLVTFNDLAPLREDSWLHLPDLDWYQEDEEKDEDEEEPEEAFYDHFWSAPCSHPDRSGDWESVTAISDFFSLREWRSSPMRIAIGRIIDRELLLPLPSPPGHSRRIRFVRFTGACDYDDTDRMLAAFVRPHVVAYLHAQELASHDVPALTTRQRQLMNLIADGRTNIQTARALGISVLTVRTHLQGIYNKLGVRSRGEAVALLYPPNGVLAQPSGGVAPG